MFTMFLPSFQRLAPLLPVMLLSLRAAPADGVAAPTRTFTQTDPLTGGTLECDRCPPGTYLRSSCSSTHRSDCARCPPGSFTELWNHVRSCLRCRPCGQKQVVKKPCAADSDCQCECEQGYYYRKNDDACLRHGECRPGRGVLTQGTADEDTVCHICPNGTFSDAVSAHQNCTNHTSCEAAGLRPALAGSTWHDSVCISCKKLRDGADYLKKILPTFFGHAKMSLRRLRRIVHNLPSEDGKKQAGTSELNLKDVKVRLDAWIASATAKQIRQLPAALTKAGANGSGERLHNKLQRIDSNLNKLCALGNEEDVALMSD
ncbi:tumor necrosis factor receptor superfamily member 6B-like [Xiphias gladius]|uniref:tumor necrosis factor receptor superfamily member 6B-like n=1 Tax=Xiphias gladius TaxID=8245 RepID=UPI001A98B62D|nr:tumor necrosis factor receptor superfamily member 6B-like [Xiphias gladius]